MKLDPADLRSLADVVVRHPSPPEVRDAHAHAHFADMIRASARELVGLDASFAAIAAAPNRFNDVSSFEWELVRLEDEVIELDAYSGTRSDRERELGRASDRMRRAANELTQLERVGWRELFTQAYGLTFNEEFLAIVVHGRVPWLVFSTSNWGDRDHVFAIEEHAITYFGECVERTDEELLGGRGLVLALRPDPG